MRADVIREHAISPKRRRPQNRIFLGDVHAHVFARVTAKPHYYKPQRRLLQKVLISYISYIFQALARHVKCKEVAIPAFAAHTALVELSVGL